MSKKRASPGDDEIKPPEISEAHSKLLTELEDEHSRLVIADQFASLYKLIPFYKKRNESLKTIDKFWLRALQNHGAFVSLYGNHTEDLEALKYLENMWVERFEPDPRAFRLEMHFKENPFFTNTVLSKTYSLKTPPSGAVINGIYESMLKFNPDLDLVISSSGISWRNDKVNLCKKFPAPKSLAGEEDELMDADLGSFFNFFDTNTDESDLGPALASDFFSEPIPFFKGEIDDDESFDEEEDDDDSIDEDSDAEEIDLERPKKRAKRA
ncbi:hypothetical protein FRC14_000480 [Serendipita sp. 396]|nr:hypothetical protein FRC14_000480 [Serendipita sp. 396]KAG8786063.1 hypothetical protein FRC15_000156 [Serendipita sp. 397]